ncbi:MAG: aspartate aminotransferase family protein [Verrucomicrobiota bacterium]|jgi:4-aminobutyrate aminotransferase|nr:aspartate aminotransferase family protein [Verrucomicrobiota bacterium]MDP6252468.1 aspartate aminotransferase family protein [Verrucomicrobiota bacterium]MDP7178929.1 aspartate aminotransferase family protein [Verrucomicrobiota bacterium]MDP7291314.1 aspartate aminotransferase family protein [Verrucomicrobiota bacterium]
MTSTNKPLGQADRTEGDVNLSAHRRDWQQANVDDATRETLARDSAVFLHQSLSTPCLSELTGCNGIYLTDAAGRRYMDFHGNSVHQVGHAHPRVIEAVKRQLDELAFCPRRFTNRPAIVLAERLAKLAPGNLAKVLFAPGGTAAIGIAMKLARYATGRHKTISMRDSFHGASLDAISVGGEALFRDGLGPLLPGCFHVAWPSAEADANAIEKILVEEGDVGAVIAEPMRCTTIERPPNGYWRRVRELCDEHGALLVFDEIPLALGRTGRMFCCEHSGVTPDILVLGKGLGGGVMPMAATIVRADLDIVPQRALGHYTHEKSPVGAAAALATLDVIESDNLLERSRKLGTETLEQLRKLQQCHNAVTDVRGLGLAMGMEVSSPDTAERVLYDCLKNGLSFKISGGTVLTLTPPLTITDEQIANALSALDDALGRP